MKFRSLKILRRQFFGEEKEFSLKEYFSEIYSNNSFKGDVSKSGPGSDLVQTKEIINSLPIILKKFEIETFCDIPCGDFNWMQKVEFGDVKYFGFDISPGLVNKLRINYQNDNRRFAELNIVEDTLSRFDLIFCRDLLVHLNFQDAKKAIQNIKDSGSKYLLTTTFLNRIENQNIVYDEKNVGWYPINLQLSPFYFSKPILVINENCTESFGNYKDKSLALYEIENIQLNLKN